MYKLHLISELKEAFISLTAKQLEGQHAGHAVRPPDPPLQKMVCHDKRCSGCGACAAMCPAHAAALAQRRVDLVDPPLIRAALFSDASNMWSESGVDLSLPGLLGDAGDLVSDPGEDPFDAIERAIAELATRGLRPIALGGDHAISFPVVRALSAIHHGLSILHVDAHPDLYDDFRQSRRSHACHLPGSWNQGWPASWCRSAYVR